MASDPTPLLRVEGLRVSFTSDDGRVTAVEDVGFDIMRGETLVILGESGSGKSVSASVIMDILDRPAGRVEAGRVRLGDTDLLALPRAKRRAINGARLAMIFQDPLSYLNPAYSIGWQIAETLRIHATPGINPKARTVELLTRVGIPDPEQRQHWFPHQFSGGQRQRVMIAMALALSPELLIADEPTTALDVTVQRQILDLLKELQAETGMSILMITHDLSVAARMADRAIVMRRGRVVETGRLDRIAASPSHPYTRELLSAIPRLESDKRGGKSPTTDGPPLLEVRDLCKDYHVAGRGFGSARAMRALNGVGFTLMPGTVLGVVGESGSGKSTLARVLMRLESVTSGQALYGGQDILKLQGSALNRFRREVQMVFQDPFGSLNPTMEIERIICEPLALHPDILPRRQWRDRAAELLEMVGLEPAHLSRLPHQFSGGQRQRIAIARALALNPRLIICDEAVSALDVSIQAQVIELLADLRRKLGLSFIFITHDLPVVRSFADDILVMKGGAVVEAGDTDTLFANPSHPYTRDLLSASAIPEWMSQAVRASIA
ncbi:ABC transporter ATP-binding protein [Paracoccus laeviglucosivorans]|uniref:Peptide/nickel transport system ATP-binding protein n=1 Tax=Paracoccus laeviglucosivorans TaxID=1197861 RepID=A0A521FB87_9RHOB|nr:ABC transporter ATP-binding protein [Paracoccus laeviglucosivorans]SMO93447.1 peptide/nickel transport system ATP-binding protein [Paracoccus laeviglucosivorans]